MAEIKQSSPGGTYVFTSVVLSAGNSPRSLWEPNPMTTITFTKTQSWITLLFEEVIAGNSKCGSGGYMSAGVELRFKEILPERFRPRISHEFPVKAIGWVRTDPHCPHIGGDGFKVKISPDGSVLFHAEPQGGFSIRTPSAKVGYQRFECSYATNSDESNIITMDSSEFLKDCFLSSNTLQAKEQLAKDAKTIIIQKAEIVELRKSIDTLGRKTLEGQRLLSIDIGRLREEYGKLRTEFDVMRQTGEVKCHSELRIKLTGEQCIELTKELANQKAEIAELRRIIQSLLPLKQIEGGAPGGVLW